MPYHVGLSVRWCSRGSASSPGSARLYRPVMTTATWDGYQAQLPDVRSMILLEEEEGEDDYGSWARQPVEAEQFLAQLPPDEREVIRGLDRRARQFSRRAGRYRATHLTLAILSIATAALVPVTIAIGMPTWLAAALGATTAVAQSIIQLTHVDQHAFEIHAMLVRLSSRRDELKAALRHADSREARSTLVDAYELDALALTANARVRLANLDGARQCPPSDAPEAGR